MAKRDFIKRQLLIIEVLRKAPQTFSSILDYLIQNQDVSGYNLEISQRTFQRDCREILSIWGVEIQFNKSTALYEIVHHDDDSILDRTLESFDLIAALNKKKVVGQHIYLEKRKSKGIEYFNGILHAIDNELVVTFHHTSYWKESSDRRCVPKAIKESQNRFYLIAYDVEKKGFRNYGLDRISNFQITSESVQTPTINVEQYYQHAFGIECYEEPTKVVLAFDNQQKQYVKSLPLHSSQKITSEDTHTFTLELFVHPTHEFLLEIMKYGAVCEVLEPLELREQVIDKVHELCDMYLNK